MVNNKTLSIAVAKSCKVTSWQNIELTWEQLVEKLSETQRTHETVSEYRVLPKTKQGEIKDIGGFVGGYLNDGMRKKGNVRHRSIITLDIDDPSTPYFMSYIHGFFRQFAGLVYSTHSHTPENPRYRLILPLSRNVSPEEYEAIARKLADKIDIENFDTTTFQPERLMYWPSTPKDGEYILEEFKGNWINADEILSEYQDWTDVSAWPRSSKVDAIVKQSITKQEDPLTKDGLIGAFCRAYTIQDAIDTFLSDIYEHCYGDRYTYIGGSTAAGLITYEDKFAYSNHSTDPTAMQLCNAYDLVRIHLFGGLDEEISDKTKMAGRPSVKKMAELMQKDENVKEQILIEKLEIANKDFECNTDAGNMDWMKRLDLNKKGDIEGTSKNIAIIFENDKNLKGLITYNRFSGKEVFSRKPFWKNQDDNDLNITENDICCIRNYFSDVYKIIAVRTIADGIGAQIMANSFHPIKDYLDSLTWDGIPRAEQLFIDSLGATDEEFTRACTRKMLIGAVNRIYEPGCKMDYAMLFLGKEGQGKSEILGVLAKRPEWFVDSFMVEGKGAYENIAGKWIVEMAELTALKKSDGSAIKNFLSKKSDHYRAAYARAPRDVQRQCVFFGTGNHLDPLKGEGGDRRFWPINISKEKKTRNWDTYTGEEIDQIWAEAKYYFELGEKPYLSESLESIANEKQKEHTMTDSWEDEINIFLDELVPTDWDTRPDAINDFTAERTVKRDRVRVQDIWVALGGISRIPEPEERRIKKIMSRKCEEWQSGRFRIRSISPNALHGWKRVENNNVKNNKI